MMAEDEEGTPRPDVANQVLELADDETEAAAATAPPSVPSPPDADDGSSSSSSSSSVQASSAVAPFLSQGEISKDAMDLDWKDPKQTRVVFYIILSLLPVLFLIPLILGSRDFIPPDLLPPVEM
jgi:hypothetical protein